MQRKIECKECTTLFGIESDGILNIKHRDLYRFAEGGRIWGPCRGCGAQVEWPEPVEKKTK